MPFTTPPPRSPTLPAQQSISMAELRTRWCARYHRSSSLHWKSLAAPHWSCCSPRSTTCGTGESCLADRLFEVVLIQLLCWMVDHSAEMNLSAGLLTGLADEEISRVLVAIHEEPGRAWTLTTMAREAHMSRSAFASRFPGGCGAAARRIPDRMAAYGRAGATAFRCVHRRDRRRARVLERVGVLPSFLAKTREFAAGVVGGHPSAITGQSDRWACRLIKQ
jgi:AraC-like DNA-binding protein